MVQYVLPDTRFGTSVPVGSGRRPAPKPAPVTAQTRSIPQVRAASSPISGDNQLAGSGAEFESRTVGDPVGGGASLTLSGLNPANLYAANKGLSSNYGKAGILGAAMINPTLGLAGLGARYITNPDSFIGKQLYGDAASFYSAAKQGGPLNTPVAKPGTPRTAPATATVATRSPSTQPRELTLDGNPPPAVGGKSGGGSSFTSGSNGLGGGSGGGGYAGSNLGGISSFGGSGNANTSGSFGGYGGGSGSYADRNDFGGFSFKQGGSVPGAGPVPATVHGGEFVLNRDMVAKAGKGSLKRGHERLNKAMSKLATLQPRAQ